jgi:hypothetical protein
MPASGRLAAALEGLADACRRGNRIELADNVGTAGRYLRAVAEGQKAAVSAGEDAGSMLISVLVDSQIGRAWSGAGRFDGRLAELCAVLAEAVRPVSPEFGDALESLAVHVTQELEKTQSTEVAARLLTFKSPAEAVAHYRKALTPKVVETLQSAARSAKTKGNAAYSERLNAYAAAVSGELAKTS